MTNNSPQFIDLVRKQLFNRYANDSLALSKSFDDILQQTIQDMNIPDSGLLQQKSFQKTIININSKVLATFIFTTRGVSYGIYVHEGLGTNRKYKRRNYLETSAQQSLEYIAFGRYQRKFMTGSPFKGLRKFNRRK
jgi:hypothetical protein